MKNEEPESQPSPPPQKAAKAKKPAPKAQKPAPKKRASTDSAPNAKKRQRRAKSESDVSELSSPLDDEDQSEIEDDSPKPTKKQSIKRKENVVESGSEDESEAVDTSSGKKEEEEEVRPEDGSESEMSVVLDEPPPKKRRQKSASAETKANAKPTKKAPAKATQNAQPVSADEAEIKRLQGWLVKCGIRKLWHKELAPFDRPKAKINHLKGMLSDVGMVGRYSLEKAEAIKEQRELAADLEAVQEGAKKWGHGDEEGSGEEEAATTARPRRRAAAASARFVDFGDSGEESD